MPKSLRNLAQEAIGVQDACNLCAVALSFGQAMIALGDHVSGTDERNQHPIAMLWADKIAHLTGTQSIANDAVMRAYRDCYALIRGAPTRGEG